MHSVVLDSLEEFLSGALEPVHRRQIDAHLLACTSCREEIQGMQEVSQLFGSLRSDEVFQPSPSFFNGVMQQVRSQQAVPSFSALFSLDFAFARRLVFASLLTLAVLGGYLVSHESDFSGAGTGVSPEALLAQQDAPSFSSGPAQDNMLVTLTAYDRR
jgi:anti-sigma factor RsiW